MRIAIIGAAELGAILTHHAVNDGGHRLAGYYDDFKTGPEFNGYPIIGPSARLADDYRAGRFEGLMMAIGYKQMQARHDLFERFKGTIPFVNLIHASCHVDRSSRLGEGVVLLPRTVIDMEVSVGDNVLMNPHVTVAHHTTIGAHSFLAPGACLSGRIEVGPCCFIGIGATVADSLHVAPWSVIGAGSVVIRDTEPHSVSVGVPARTIKYRNR